MILLIQVGVWKAFWNFPESSACKAHLLLLWNSQPSSQTNAEKLNEIEKNQILPFPEIKIFMTI